MGNRQTATQANKTEKRSARIVLASLLLIATPGLVWAAKNDVPVVDLGHASAQDATYQSGLEIDQDELQRGRPINNRSNESVEQRVVRMERQISNLAEMNFASKLEKMQQELQQLHGQIEVQNHDLTQLKEQLRNFYQDLDQRLTKIQPDDAKLPVKKKVLAEEEDTKTAAKETTEGDGSKTKELKTYETAFNLLNKKEYDQAITGFQAFVKDYPSSNYSVNAHYWLGEIYYLKDKPDLANKEFQIIVSNYPDSAKVSDALLKIALIAMDNGNYNKAKQNLIKVQKQFPGTTAAKIATLRLKELKQKK